MPQLSMLPGTPLSDGIRLTITDLTPHLDPAWHFQVEGRLLDCDWMTLTLDRYSGVMTDFASTWATDVVAAFLFDEGLLPAKMAAQSVYRAAWAHQHAHRSR